MKFYVPSHGQPFSRGTDRQYIYAKVEEGFRIVRLNNYPNLKLGILSDPDMNETRDEKIADGEWIEVRLGKDVKVS